MNLDVFRQIVLMNYSNKCAVSGINIPELLIANHILPWSDHEAERLNPQNGISLSPLFDTCFNKGYISIVSSYKIYISSVLKEKSHQLYFDNII